MKTIIIVILVILVTILVYIALYLLDSGVTYSVFISILSGWILWNNLTRNKNIVVYSDDNWVSSSTRAHFIALGVAMLSGYLIYKGLGYTIQYLDMYTEKQEYSENAKGLLIFSTAIIGMFLILAVPFVVGIWVHVQIPIYGEHPTNRKQLLLKQMDIIIELSREDALTMGLERLWDAIYIYQEHLCEEVIRIHYDYETENLLKELKEAIQFRTKLENKLATLKEEKAYLHGWRNTQHKDY